MYGCVCIYMCSSPIPIKVASNGIMEETKRCTICLNTREGDTEFIAPCCCRGSVRYVHEQCLKAWIIRSPQCNVCLEYYSLPKNNHLQKLWLSAGLSCLVYFFGALAWVDDVYVGGTSDSLLGTKKNSCQ
ncbi:hypothetical protein BCR42DRAFT_54505 [Absidia repens]|uniref:RING-CH-type domain-containing protein n=1 Tax=Absidia repens TaxID=90262 RepID=A0A1X2IEZ1_9FUNG|nr:hypothetical protein BCR42DRAFT_54505 [Absidia repens]